jgi:hypothetical protein
VSASAKKNKNRCKRKSKTTHRPHGNHPSTLRMKSGRIVSVSARYKRLCNQSPTPDPRSGNKCGTVIMHSEKMGQNVILGFRNQRIEIVSSSRLRPGLGRKTAKDYLYCASQSCRYDQRWCCFALHEGFR